MAGLRKAPFAGEIAFLGANSSRDEDLASAPLSSVRIGFEGFEGEDHGGLNRAACSRLTNVHPEGTTIKNQRQVTVLSEEELAETAADMGIEEGLDPAWVGANLVLKGVPSLTLLPPGTRLQMPDGGTLVVDLENGPCKYPGFIIDLHHPGKGKTYPIAAYGKRGFTAFVEREGVARVGDRVEIFYPQQALHPLLQAL